MGEMAHRPSLEIQVRVGLLVSFGFGEEQALLLPWRCLPMVWCVDTVPCGESNGILSKLPLGNLAPALGVGTLQTWRTKNMQLPWC